MTSFPSFLFLSFLFSQHARSCCNTTTNTTNNPPNKRRFFCFRKDKEEARERALVNECIERERERERAKKKHFPYYYA